MRTFFWSSLFSYSIAILQTEQNVNKSILLACVGVEAALTVIVPATEFSAKKNLTADST